MGKNGCCYFDNQTFNRLNGATVKPVNTSGAGDAFMAGLVYSSMNEMNIDECAKFATAASIAALSHQNAVNPNISIELIHNIITELKI